MSLAGNLRDLSLADLLQAAEHERRTGVLRLRQTGTDGPQRGDLILRDGTVVGAALYRGGGVTGMGEALVEAALSSPEDASAALHHAAASLVHVPGMLAAGAGRAGVSLSMVEDCLHTHIRSVTDAMRRWRTGSWEIAAEGFPAGSLEKDSAAARAFLLDQGLTAEEALATLEAASQPMPVPSEPPSAAPTETTVGDARLPGTASDDWFDDAQESFTQPGPEDAPLFVAPPEDPASAVTDKQPAVVLKRPEAAPADIAPPDDDPDALEDEGPDPGFSAGTDLSGPGAAESALMEAETLLDGEVLSVMLEMGNSAAATAAAVVPDTDAVRTGDLLVIDEDSTLAQLLVPPLREAGYVVHAVRGRKAAIERVAGAADNGERPLVLCDLLLTRDEGGMLGGLEVAAYAATLEPSPPLVLLAETSSEEVQASAERARVVVVLPRPLKSELKKDVPTRDEFLDRLLHVIDEHRPRAEWRVGNGTEGGEQVSEPLPIPARDDGGWNVEEIEAKAAQAEEIPEFVVVEPSARREALWREAMRDLSGPLAPPEILLQILRFGAEVLTRGVLFTPAGKGELKGFGQFGVELAPDEDPDEAVRRIRFPHAEHPGIRRVLEERVAVHWVPEDTPWEAHLVRGLGGRAPSEVFLGPVFCQGRLAALFYGDMLPSHDPIPDSTNFEVLLGQAGLALDRHVLETRIAVLEGTDPGRRRTEDP